MGCYAVEHANGAMLVCPVDKDLNVVEDTEMDVEDIEDATDVAVAQNEISGFTVGLGGLGIYAGWEEQHFYKNNRGHSELSGLRLGVWGDYGDQDLAGVDLSIFSKSKGDVSGVAFAVAANRFKNVNGFQGSIVCSESESVKGLQLSVGVNRTYELHGAQIAVLHNVAVDADGFQLSGFNHVSGHGQGLRGMQIGVANFADTITGFQIGGASIANDLKNSVQLSLLNNAQKSTRCSLSLGIFNTGTNTNGAQFGIINSTADSTTGAQFGVYNTTKKLQGAGMQIGIYSAADQVSTKSTQLLFSSGKNNSKF